MVASVAPSPHAPPPFAADAPLSLVVNRSSGRPDTDAACAILEQVLGAANRRYTLRKVADAGELERAVDDAIAEATATGGAVVAGGGDGTLNTVAARALEAGLPFGALPQGTFNLFCRDHGIPLDPEAAARSLLHARPVPVQVGRVGGRPFLVNATVGLYPELLEDRERCKQRYGRSRAIAFGAGLWTLLRSRGALDVDIDVAGQGSRHVRTRSLFVGNNQLQLDRIGIGDVDPSAFDTLTAVIVRPIGTLALLGLALRGALGRLGDSAYVDPFEFRRLEIVPRRRRRLKVSFDGEVVDMPAPIVFDVAPQPLWLLLPAPEDRVAVR